ncbi:MAG: signal recognition particle-docking protein FtsY [Lachnospirales bacterium]
MGIFDFLKKNKNEEIEKEKLVEESSVLVEDGAGKNIILNDDNSETSVEKNEHDTIDVVEDAPEEIIEEVQEEIIEEEKEETSENSDNEEIIIEKNTETIIDLSGGEDGVENNSTEEKVGFFTRMKNGLSKTRSNIMGNVENVLKAFTKIDEEFYEELEDALIFGDLGASTASYIMDRVRDRAKAENIKDTEEIRNVLIEEITDILEKDNEPLVIDTKTVILVIGVNGAGKTTTIGKLSAKYKNEGKSVLLVAADTFRAAAIDQLQVWGDRSGINVIKHQENSDPGAVVFDAVKSAKAKGIDVLICDTAGRLHNKKNLMEELRKIQKIINREYEEAKVEVFLVLDGTTGQNALQQAKLFNEVADITGIVLTKLDGTAKGGVVIGIKNEMNIPVRYVGFGEAIEDLGEFNSKEFAKALFEG